MKKIKVLQTIRQGKIGGGESHVLDLISTIDKTKFEPIVLSFTEGPMVEKAKKWGIETHVIYTEKPFDIRVWKKVKKIMVNCNIDIVHAHGTRAVSNSFWAAKQLHLPLIYTVHGWSFHQDQNLLVKKSRVLGEKYLTQKANVTISVSNNNQQDGIKLFNLNNSQVINHGINTQKFDPHGKLLNLYSELNLPQNKTIVGFLARMTKQKAPITLIKAIQKVKKQTNDIVFLLMGNGDLLKGAKKLVKKLKLENMVIWSDFRQDMPNVLNSIDIYVLPSLWEGLPIGLLEAMAMEKAIVATAVDGTKEVIQSKKNGILVPCKNSESLAKAILKLHLNPELRKVFGKKSRQIVLEKYSLQRMCNEIEKLYKNQLKKQ